MANKHMKRCSHHSLLEKYKSKLPWGITSYQSEWSSEKELQTINAREHVEKLEPCCTAGGRVNWHCHSSVETHNKLGIQPPCGGGLAAKSCLALVTPVDCSPPSSFVHGISQARILERVAIFFYRRYSQFRDWTHIPCVEGGLLNYRHILYHLPTREAPKLPYDPAILLLGIYPEKATIQNDTCTPMFITALFTIARTWKEPRCPSTNEWIKKLWYTGIYSVIKRNKSESVVVR